MVRGKGGYKGKDDYDKKRQESLSEASRAVFFRAAARTSFLLSVPAALVHLAARIRSVACRLKEQDSLRDLREC
jgi:hypothetical protein